MINNYGLSVSSCMVPLLICIGGSKHGQVYKKMLRYTKTIICLVKHLKVVAKCCLNWTLFKMPSIIVLGAQILNIKMRSSNLLLKYHSKAND